MLQVLCSPGRSRSRMHAFFGLQNMFFSACICVLRFAGWRIWWRCSKLLLVRPGKLDWIGSPMESGGGARVRRQLQAVGRVAAYVGGGFLVLSAASTAAVRSLRYLSDANQRKFATPCGSCEGKGTYACRLCRGSSTVEWSPLYDPVFINPCLCPTCDGTRVQRCLNCLGKCYA